MDADLPPGYKLVSVRLGDWDTTTYEDCDDSEGEEVCNDPPVDVPIASKIPHPSYTPRSRTNYNDIALLRLKRSVQETQFIKPICLPSDPRLRNHDYTDESLVAAG